MPRWRGCPSPKAWNDPAGRWAYILAKAEPAASFDPKKRGFALGISQGEASDYIKKPFHDEELYLKVKMVLENIQAKRELEELRTKVYPEEEYRLLFGMSDRMRKVQTVLDQVAGTDITVLISGESGTGKELVAKAIHKSSDRRNEPFVKVNCAALPRELLESELFGFEKGAFTGAHRRKYGRFEMAQNGTIFLDEISEMHMDLQSKLLHVLQEKQFFRIGGEREVKAGCRILCATNRNLDSKGWWRKAGSAATCSTGSMW